jgi:hypothetical protein
MKQQERLREVTKATALITPEAWLRYLAHEHEDANPLAAELVRICGYGSEELRSYEEHEKQYPALFAALTNREVSR